MGLYKKNVSLINSVINLFLSILVVLGCLLCLHNDVFAEQTGSEKQNSDKANITIASKKIKKFSLDNDYYSRDRSFINGDYYTLVTPKGNKNIMVEMININSGKRTTRKITVGGYDYLGGAFKLADGNIYVVTGCDNKKESETKNVISVIKYDSNWKKLGVCKIKANAKNVYPGIVTPFRSGNVDMCYLNGYAYLKTSRTMFKQPDGLNHQSNIQFIINTANMTYKCAIRCYVSHSFAQYVTEKDGSLYQADLGDAYPRSLVVTITDEYNPEDGFGKHPNRCDVIKFKGEIGDNNVNASLDGIEVGNNNVLTCGTSAPHYMEVAGVTGWRHKKKNVYVGVTDRETGESKVVWITKDNPDKTHCINKVMLFSKINDDRFVILYSKKNVPEHTYKIYCAIVDNSGELITNKIVRKRSVADYYNYGMTPPVFRNGKIVWLEPVYKKKTIVEKYGKKKYKYQIRKHVKNVLYTVNTLIQ